MNAPGHANETIINPDALKPKLRLKFPIAIAVLFWLSWIINGRVEKAYFTSFMTELATSGVFILLFLGWWWFNRGLRLKEKFIGFVLIVGGAFVAGKIRHVSLNPFLLITPGIPIIATVILAIFFRERENRRTLIGLPFVAGVVLVWASFSLIRMDGADSALKNALHWRWTPSAEERFLAENRSHTAKKPAAALDAAPGELDWTAFRGANRDGIIHGSSIATNWTGNVPTLVWKRAVGPAWSSMITIGERLFTQEQRGATEAVVCYDANDGQEIWAHEDEIRFEEALSGIGPRATPTFEKGRLYTYGGKGILNCLDAATGKMIWKKDVRADSGFPVAMWGFSSSPLVIDGRVIIYAGGPKGILAYRTDNGDLAWTAPGGEMGYSSGQGVMIDGASQCLMLIDTGLIAFNPTDGKKLWEAGSASKGPPRCTQPRLIAPGQLLVGGLDGAGMSLIQVSKKADAWNVTPLWTSKDLKPEFPDYVVYKDHAYGFDASIFACIRLSDGKREWKDGRYGMGQVVLLADQGLLLVSSEKGELILLPADPTANKELGRIQAIEGKTWNSPVVRGDRIFHRNAQEMACYRAAATPAKVAQK